MGNARIEDSTIEDLATVRGFAFVMDDAHLYGGSLVAGRALTYARLLL